MSDESNTYLQQVEQSLQETFIPDLRAKVTELQASKEILREKQEQLKHEIDSIQEAQDKLTKLMEFISTHGAPRSRRPRLSKPEKREKILNAIRGSNLQAMTIAELTEIVDIDQHTIRETVRELVREGVLLSRDIKRNNLLVKNYTINPEDSLDHQA